MKSFLILILASAIPAVALAQEPSPDAPTAEATEPAEHAMTSVEDIAFEPIEVPGFDSGMKIAVVHGDPMAESGDYTIRLSFPDGYRFPAHWHPKAEHVTVLDGVFLLAMGDATGDDSTLTEYQPGDFLYLPAKNPHYGGATGETVIQLHGEAPFKIELAEASE